MNTNCVLCAETNSELLWQDNFCRVVLLNDVDYPGYCRVELLAHVKEMTDLSISQRSQLMKVVCVVEQAIRDVLQPSKINLASLGNKTPHLHWHVVPRFQDDKHFPNSHWGAAMRENTYNILSEQIKTSLKTAISHSLED